MTAASVDFPFQQPPFAASALHCRAGAAVVRPVVVPAAARLVVATLAGCGPVLGFVVVLELVALAAVELVLSAAGLTVPPVANIAAVALAAVALHAVAVVVATHAQAMTVRPCMPAAQAMTVRSCVPGC